MMKRRPSEESLMYYVLNANTLYDIEDEEKVEISIIKDKKKYDVTKFLDDISLWINDNRPLMEDRYLPFSVLSVGVVPLQVSAFMYGLFVGKALSKNNVQIKISATKVNKEDMVKEIESNMDYYDGVIGNALKNKLKESADDSDEQNTGEERNK